jgi:predicted enzyme related to lactoylglutathione lyase
MCRGWSACHPAQFHIAHITVKENNQNMTIMPTMKLEVVPLPVADIDRAKDFYMNKVGFNLDHDSQPSDTIRIVQLTPPGSGCSIVMGTGMGEISEMIPGSIKGLHLVVKSVREVRDILIERGVAVGEIIEYPREIRFAHFSDPDGNSWALQEFPSSLASKPADS